MCAITVLVTVSSISATYIVNAQARRFPMAHLDASYRPRPFSRACYALVRSFLKVVFHVPLRGTEATEAASGDEGERTLQQGGAAGGKGKGKGKDKDAPPAEPQQWTPDVTDYTITLLLSLVSVVGALVWLGRSLQEEAGGVNATDVNASQAAGPAALVARKHDGRLDNRTAAPNAAGGNARCGWLPTAAACVPSPRLAARAMTQAERLLPYATRVVAALAALVVPMLAFDLTTLDRRVLPGAPWRRNLRLRRRLEVDGARTLNFVFAVFLPINAVLCTMRRNYVSVAAIAFFSAAIIWCRPGHRWYRYVHHATLAICVFNQGFLSFSTRPLYFRTHPAVLVFMRINRVLFSTFLNSRIIQPFSHAVIHELFLLATGGWFSHMYFARRGSAENTFIQIECAALPQLWPGSSSLRSALCNFMTGHQRGRAGGGPRVGAAVPGGGVFHLDALDRFPVQPVPAPLQDVEQAREVSRGPAGQGRGRGPGRRRRHRRVEAELRGVDAHLRLRGHSHHRIRRQQQVEQWRRAASASVVVGSTRFRPAAGRVALRPVRHPAGHARQAADPGHGRQGALVCERDARAAGRVQPAQPRPPRVPPGPPRRPRPAAARGARAPPPAGRRHEGEARALQAVVPVRGAAHPAAARRARPLGRKLRRRGPAGVLLADELLAQRAELPGQPRVRELRVVDPGAAHRVRLRHVARARGRRDAARAAAAAAGGAGVGGGAGGGGRVRRRRGGAGVHRALRRRQLGVPRLRAAAVRPGRPDDLSQDRARAGDRVRVLLLLRRRLRARRRGHRVPVPRHAADDSGAARRRGGRRRRRVRPVPHGHCRRRMHIRVLCVPVPNLCFGPSSSSCRRARQRSSLS